MCALESNRREIDHAVRGADGSVLHYGSAPGELAACLRNVGLAQRPEYRVLTMSGRPHAIDAASERLTGHLIVEGGALKLADLWWVRPVAGRLLLIGSAPARDRAICTIGARVRQSLAVSVDTAKPVTVISLLGPRVDQLLFTGKVYGHEDDARDAAPCFVGLVGLAPIVWIRESSDCVLACFSSADAPAVLRDLEQRGRPLGLVRVGRQAVNQFFLVQRHRAAQTLVG